MLDKCIILGICGILNDNFCMNFLDNNKKTKILLIKILIHFVMNHKNENLILKNIMKRELKCNFVGEKDDDNDDYEEEIDFSFNSIIKIALNDNSIIQNSDEFKFFRQIMKYV